MRAAGKKLLDSWFSLLDGNLANSLPVYIESVPEEETGNYVLLRIESETDTEKNAKTWIKEVVLICDIVTVFEVAVNPDTAADIFNEIGILLADGPAHRHNLTQPSGMIINSVTDEQTTLLQEDDGAKKIYRSITRFNHLVTIQL